LITDTVPVRAFISHDCEVFPNIKGGIKSVINLQEYPIEAKKYQISGIVKVSALIDKNGKLYCYSIKTDLGDIFKNQAESVLKKLEFEKAICNNHAVAYISTFQLRYDYQKTGKDKDIKTKN
jgi:outer membrane biosynthesis protein TonB